MTAEMKEQVIETMERRYGYDHEWIRYFSHEIWSCETIEEIKALTEEVEHMIGIQKGAWTKIRIILEHM